ncbi:MAG: Flp pilus assembly protein CpaB [Desulfobaccales bacterium]
MRRLPPWLWLMLALVFGAMATFMAMGWLKSQSRKVVQQKTETVPVVVAVKEVPAAVALSGDQVKVREWPADSPLPGKFSRLEDVEGRVTAVPLSPGEPILEAKLAPKGVIPGLTALLSPDKRAMTVKVDEASGVAGFLNPDNRVDVVVTVDKGDFNKDPISKVVLQNIRVLGTGQRIEKKLGEKPQVVPTVTLEVSPEEGVRLALAVQEGKIFLILRNQQDEMLVKAAAVRASTLLGGASPDGGRETRVISHQMGAIVMRGPYRSRKGTGWEKLDKDPSPQIVNDVRRKGEFGTELAAPPPPPREDLARAEQ